MVMKAANVLTSFRRKIVSTGAVNVMWAQYNEVKLGDYTSISVAADASRTTPVGYQPLLLTPFTNWIFALDEKDLGVAQHWYNASWREVGNWSRVGTMDGWGSATALRAWEAAHPHEKYSGAGWFRYTFSGTALEQQKAPRTLALAVSAACGSLTGWINGAPLRGAATPVTPEEPLLLEMPAGAVELVGPNILALRFEDTGGACASSANGAGLRGRVFVVGK